MRFYEVNRKIRASPAQVWAVLSNPEVLSEGGFGIVRIEGSIAAGGRIKLWSEVDPKRAFALTVAVFEAPHRMEWHGGMPFGLFKGVRTFTITPVSGGCDFRMREEFSGLMSGIITRSMPDLQPGFDRFGDALKRHAEAVR